MSQGCFASLNVAFNVGDEAACVQENRRRLAVAIGYDSQRLWELSQVHGSTLVNTHGEGLGAEPAPQRTGDGLLASTPSVSGRSRDLPARGSLRARGASLPGVQSTPWAIGVRVADCVAVLLACPVTGSVAALHAGWRGVVGGIVVRGVDALVHELGAVRQHLLAAIFPHIGEESFEVGEDVAAQIAQAVPEDASVIVRKAAWPRPHASLARAITAQLVRVGVSSERVERVAGCTFSDADNFFSYRRDGSSSGRHLAVILPRC